jgi:hypothetical protein
LVFQSVVVVVRGRNLYSVAEAIEREVCEWIQPFNPAKWDEPIDPAAPFIDSIVIHTERPDMLKAIDALTGEQAAEQRR